MVTAGWRSAEFERRDGRRHRMIDQAALRRWAAAIWSSKNVVENMGPI